MREKEREEGRGKKGLRVTRFSRRQFLQRVGIAAGGAALAAISLESACQPSGSTTTGTTTTSNPPTSSLPTSSSSTTATSVAPTSTTSAPTTTTAPATTTFSYVPPTTLPPLIPVPGTKCLVANDGRLYSPDHIWVQSISANQAVLGITDTFVTILYDPYSLTLPEVGTTLVRGDSFGMIEGYKMAADMLSPVSGTVIGRNEILARTGKGGEIWSLITAPFTGGWMFVLQLTKPDELKGLMTAQSYRDYVATLSGLKGLLPL